ncbi:MAG: DUF3500 domain-containing protein [Planctomycetes bacterium]|nr:DUF3500 domain-containing protein [Planctomycetota bacterium]
MKRRLLIAACAALILTGGGWTWLRLSAGVQMTQAADAFLATLSEEEKKQTVYPYDTPKRLEWHFIPKDERKGLQVKEMNEQQQKALNDLLRAALSESGYDKSKKIMELETVLNKLEQGGRNIRDAERYYATVFGNPSETERWGLSFEGHHLSLNFVVDEGKVVSSTPAFLGANPAIVTVDLAGTLPKGTRVLASEEVLAFELLNALDDEQRSRAIIAEKAPQEIRAAGEPQPPKAPPAGLTAARMTDKQKGILTRLIEAYAGTMPEEVKEQRITAIEAAGLGNIHFAWAGATKPGIGHYYRLQGPTFLIEFINVQPDAAGNPANHIHSIWRDMAGDFAIPATL